MAGHASQLADPVPVLYVPAWHCEHRPPFSPVNPALHLQSVTAMLFIDEELFAGHCKQLFHCNATPMFTSYRFPP